MVYKEKTMFRKRILDLIPSVMVSALLTLALVLVLGVPLSQAAADAPLAPAAILTVDTLLDNESDGCGVNACTLREAIADAAAGDTIAFDASLSGGTIVLGGIQLDLNKTLSIEANVPITVSANNASRVFNISASGVVTLTTLTIRDGKVTGNGGGIYNSGTLHLEDTQVLSNSATSRGGGLYVNQGSAVLNNTQVFSNTAARGAGLGVGALSAVLNMYGGELHDNSAADNGGGLYAHSGGAVFSDTQVFGNSASNFGGGLYIHDSNSWLEVYGGEVRDNSATVRGGGIYTYQGDMVVSDTRVFGNSAEQGGGLYVREPGGWLYMYGGVVHDNTASSHGGGLRIEYGNAVLIGTLVLTNSATYGGGLDVATSNANLDMYGGEVRGNSASNRGGGLHIERSAVVLSGTQVLNNSASDGGGLYTRFGSVMLNIDGGEVRDNSASDGGGLYMYQGSAVLSNTQVIGNSATDDGGGLFVLQSTAALTMAGGEVRDNSAADNGGGLFVGSGSATLGGTLVTGNSAADGDAVYNNVGTVSSASALTLSGEVYQANGTFAASSYDLDIQGTLVLAGGDFYAPDAPSSFTLSGDFIHTGGSYYQTQVVIGSADFGFPKEGGLIINANGLDLDSTAVTVTAGTECAGVTPGEAVQHCYIISPTITSGRAATVTFFYRDNEVPSGHYCNVMEAYRWDGTWDNLLTRDMAYGSQGRLCGSDPQSIRVMEVSDFSPFVLRGPTIDVSISKVVTPTQAAPGEAITYVLSFSNMDVLVTPGIVITDHIPISVTGTSVISSGVAITPRVGTRYVWDVANLAPGAGGVITITGTLSEPLAAGTFTNTATITASLLDLNPEDNESSAGVTVQNVAPVANDDSFDVAEDSVDNALDVLDNDGDANGDTLIVDALGTPDQGGTLINAGTHVTYTPALNFNGTETFTYTVSDGNGGFDTATVFITVLAVNDPPVANDDAYTTEFEIPLVVDTENGVLANDTDPDGDPLTATLDSGPLSGTLSLNLDGSFVYTPTAGFSGLDSFVYVASDGALTDTANVVIGVGAIPTYTLTIAVDGTGSGTVTPTVGVHIYNEGEVVTLTATPDAGSEFIGWSGDASGNTTPLLIAMTETKSITATFELIPDTEYKIYLPFITRQSP